MPTAVITESSENTASSTTICATTGQNLAPRFCGFSSSSLPSNRSFNSMVALNSKKIPPISMIRSRALKGCPIRVNRGVIREESQEIEASSSNRITNASNRPVTRALSRRAGGSFSARMAIKTRLSIPRTSSKTIRVTSPAQIEGSAIHSNITHTPAMRETVVMMIVNPQRFNK